MTFFKWSRTAAADATADSTINWAEGQSPSSVNDSARAMMAATAKYRDDISGAIATGGTSTAYTVTSYQVFDTLAHLSGQMIAFTPHATNGATVTLNVDGLGAKPLRSAPSAELLPGTLIQGTPYIAVYNSTDGAFYLKGFYGNPYNVPIASGIDYWGTSAPNSAFAFPYGQAISRTTYSSLFSVISTFYGTGDGSTTFNLPDVRGRVRAGMDTMAGLTAGRLTATLNGSGIGGVGGSETKTLTTANLPPYTPSGTVNVTSQSRVGVSTGFSGGGATQALVANGSGNQANNNTTSILIDTTAQTFTGNAQGGTSTPMAIIQPTITCNYILRII